jgi:DNA polymerase III delta subunit
MLTPEVIPAFKNGSQNKFLILGDTAYSLYVLKSLIKKNMPDLELKQYEDVSDFKHASLVDTAFMGLKRAHVVLDLDAGNIDGVLEYSQNIDRDELLLVVCPKKLGRNKSYTNMKTAFGVVEEEEIKPYGDQWEEWLQSYWISRGITFSQKASSALVSRVVKSRMSLIKSTEALLLYSGEYKFSELEIEEYFPVNAVSDFFGFLDDFLNSKVERVYSKIDSIKDSEVIGLVRSLLNEMEKVLKIIVYMSDNVTDEVISAKTGVHIFVLRSKYKKLARSIGKAKMMRNLNMFVEVEKRVKLSSHSSKEVLKAYCLKAM